MRFLVGFVLGVLLPVLAVFAAVPQFAGVDVPEGHWVWQCLEKKRDIALATPPGAIVILGGSNALFGYSAKEIEDLTGVPAVNLAVNSGLGLAYMLDEAEGLIKPGDLVVLSLEYDFYAAERTEAAKALQIIAHDQAYLGRTPFFARLRFLASVNFIDWGRLLRAKLLRQPPPGPRYALYNAATLDDRGDETYNEAANRDPSWEADLRAQPAVSWVLDDRALDRIAAFRDGIAAHGARLVLTYPNVLASTVDLAANAGFSRDLRAGLAARGLAIIGDPEAAEFPLDLAFDTKYHQIREGQQHSTARLIGELAAAGLLPPRGETSR